LSNGARVAFGAVEHAVRFGARHGGCGQSGERGGDHRAQRQAEFAPQRRDDAAHP
jgi:hypothetical protein